MSSSEDEVTRAAVKMVRLAVASELPPDTVMPFMRVLYDHMSDRNLAKVGAVLMGCEEGVALNWVYEAAQLQVDAKDVEDARRKLVAAGLEDWIDED